MAGSGIGLASGWARFIRIRRLPMVCAGGCECRCGLFAALAASDAGWESGGVGRCRHPNWPDQTTDDVAWMHLRRTPATAHEKTRPRRSLKLTQDRPRPAERGRLRNVPLRASLRLIRGLSGRARHHHIHRYRYGRRASRWSGREDSSRHYTGEGPQRRPARQIAAGHSLVNRPDRPYGASNRIPVAGRSGRVRLFGLALLAQSLGAYRREPRRRA